MCLDKFTYSSRRHHCRNCGILCCAVCSTKRLCLKTDGHRSSSSKGIGNPPPPSPVPTTSGERVCDGCFNKLSFEAGSRDLLMQKAQREIAKEEPRSPPPAPAPPVSSPATAAPASSGSAAGISLPTAQIAENAEMVGDLKLRSDRMLQVALSCSCMCMHP